MANLIINSRSPYIEDACFPECCCWQGFASETAEPKPKSKNMVHNGVKNEEENGGVHDDPLESRDTFLFCAGLRYTGTWGSILHTSFVLVVTTLGAAHYVLKVVFLTEEEGLVVGVEAFHYIVLMSGAIFTALQILFNYRVYKWLVRRMCSDNAETERRAGSVGKRVLARNMAQVKFRRRAVVWSVMFAHVMCAAKESVMGGSGWVTPYKGWFPFPINSHATYWGASIFQIISMTHLALMVIAVVSVYISLAGHVCGELKILQVSVDLCFKRAAAAAESVARSAAAGNKEAEREVFESTLYLNIKQCIRHHVLISEFFMTFQALYSSILLAWSLAFIFMICTIGFLVTDPYVPLNDSLPLSSLLLPEVSTLTIICWDGQKISDQVDILREVVYNTDWYNQSPRVKHALRMILTRCKSSMVIKGGGLQSYSLIGLREMLVSSYSYFNMLIALRN